MNTKLIPFIVGLFALTALGQQKPAYSDVEAGKHAGEEATVTGKLVTVSTSGKGTTFLNFGARFPKQTFSGIIFAGKESAVGDVKQYEGKEVALTGKIEMSSDQKPQIIISSASQIKLADAALQPMPAATAPLPATAPAATASTAPSTVPPATAPQPYVSKQRGKVALAMNWTNAGKGGEIPRKDLAKLFGATGKASESVDVDASIEVYPGVRFLTALADAKKILHLENQASIKTKIATPGLPQGSFSANTFAGVFAGGYTRIHLVTDNADQVVSVLLVDSNTASRVQNEPDTTGYHTYNFITGAAKSTAELLVRHQILAEGAPPGLVIVDSMFIDPRDPESPTARPAKSKSSTFTKPKTGKLLERSRWFVPSPLVDLILRSLAQ